MRYWATPNCATLGHSDLLWATLGYSGPLWATLGYSELLWATLGYSGLLWTTLNYSELLWTSSIGLWTLDLGLLRVTNWTTHYHKDSFKTFIWLIGLLNSFMSSLLLFRLLKLSFIMFSLNLVDYPMFSLLLSTWNDLGHLTDTQGY